MRQKEALMQVNLNMWLGLSLLLRSSPMGPCQGMSDSARAAEALTKGNIVLANNLKNYTPSEHKDENKI